MANKNFKVKNSITSPEPIAITEGGTGQTSATNALNALLPVQTSATNKYLQSDGTNASWATISGSFVAMPSSSINTNTSLSSNYRYFVDTSATRTLTLPASPATGDEIQIFDSTGSAGTYNITVNSNSGKINGSVQNLTVDVSGAAFALIYTGSTYGWVVR
jgi:hypothetical protein